MAVDGQGRPLRLILTPGQRGDVPRRPPCSKGSGPNVFSPTRPMTATLCARSSPEWERKLSSLAIRPEEADPLRLRSLQSAQPHRTMLQQTQALQTHSHTLRPTRHPFPQLHPTRLHQSYGCDECRFSLGREGFDGGDRVKSRLPPRRSRRWCHLRPRRRVGNAASACPAACASYWFWDRTPPPSPMLCSPSPIHR